ncbi:MAG: hypothetical protein S4CHLAM2_03190 [Chlamydiales bacterium]|nr:hypothetical protein [Chlamydiales bacterium]
MFLPPNLQHSIDLLTKNIQPQDLIDYSHAITDHYQEGRSLSSPDSLLTYLTVRFPATYASIFTVLSQVPFPVSSLLDLGAGPATAWFAATQIWGEIHATCIERELDFIHLGKQLGCAAYTLGDIEKIPSYRPHDLAVFGYSYGELAHFDFAPVWAAVQGVVIIEPGTPRGFQNVLSARDQLIALGGHVAAPCPHSQPCPHPTWCHFSVRVNRSERHRHAKEASLPYEDEKYSYVIVTKEPLNPEKPRLISTPQKRSGHVNMELCTVTGIEKRTVSKKQKELYRAARKAKWGDTLN